jgi:hypothetical protein
MSQGVLVAIEAEAVSSPTGTGPGTGSGSGSGEHMTGILKVAGTTPVAFNTDVPTTLRSAVTALQNIGVMPNGWALNPADAQSIDLLRWGSQGGLLTGGFEQTGPVGQATLADNIFGTTRPGGGQPVRAAGHSHPGRLVEAEVVRALGHDAMVNAFGDSLFSTNAVQMRGSPGGRGHPATRQLRDRRPDVVVMAADSSITAFKDGANWRWRWTAPWATTHDSSSSHKSKTAAIAAGNQWLKDHRGWIRATDVAGARPDRNTERSCDDAIPWTMTFICRTLCHTRPQSSFLVCCWCWCFCSRLWQRSSPQNDDACSSSF